jgi:CRISPR-associated exonuclease Cas4
MLELPDYLPISMLNQLAYCERRFWLMYVCGEMEINASVLEGIHQHRRAHEGTVERDGERIIHRRVYLWSDRLRISGFADLVEETPGGGEAGSLSTSAKDATEPPGLPWFGDENPVGAGSSRPGPSRPTPRVLMPVEYKRGRQGRWLNDQLQLCAQALCLEERTAQPVERGQIFYWRSRRRVDVEFTPELRAQAEDTVARAYALIEAGRMPPPIERRAKCRECSLEGICLPREVLLLSGEGQAD